MSERRTNLVAEPGERVEVERSFGHWEDAVVLWVETRWYSGNETRNSYHIAFLTYEGTRFCYEESAIRKPQAAPEQQ